MTTTFNPYGGDANVHQLPVYELPITQGDKGFMHRIWYRYFLNAAQNISYGICTVANLPAQTAGTFARGAVSDSTGSTFYSTLTGGGTTTVPVFFDGTVWRIG